jgi:polar amino acid transport system ATP-binding protein
MSVPMGEVPDVSVLRTENLRKTYGGKVVLRDIDLEVEEHDVVCLIGSSGSGKSTLLRCLDLLEDIDDGAIFFEGRDISDPRVDARAVRRRMGIVFQAYNLFPHLSVLDNLTLAPRKVHGVDRSTAETRAQRLLEGFGLADKVHEHPDRLSGGQQQRVAMARAMATNPALLLLDEVTAALDPELTGEVLEIIKQLAFDGTTMVLATHEMTFARDVATKVCFLHDGAILEQGPPAEIFEDPREERTRQFLRRVLPNA